MFWFISILSLPSFAGNNWSLVKKSPHQFRGAIIPNPECSSSFLYSEASAKLLDDDGLDIKHGRKLYEYTEMIPLLEDTYVDFSDAIREPYHGPILMLKVQLRDGRAGWIDTWCFAPMTKVVNVRSDDVLNVRASRTWKSKKVATVAPGERLFYSLRDFENQVGMKGCEKEFVKVWTLDGVMGYVNCRYIE